jgi:hypothetical protein
MDIRLTMVHFHRSRSLESGQGSDLGSDNCTICLCSLLVAAPVNREGPLDLSQLVAFLGPRPWCAPSKKNTPLSYAL